MSRCQESLRSFEVEKTKSEAQALVTAAVTLAQNEWDALSDEEKVLRGPRPTAITIP